ncbi:hypothetical protein DCAR_0310955 [Daucus carota subsp. sativus]|uniref:Uncharacterized protein n=1 Tax=Daucus carota subsp. sativus TaxID=79200 RepID=A0A161XWL8_DAUCS|nr:hypothetical protein DCAR_0310955 [Daucus carota subsp. sativus]
MVNWAILACLLLAQILFVSGKSVFSGSSPPDLRVQTGIGSHVAKSPVSSTKPTDSDSLTSTTSSETAETTDSSSSKADPKIRQVKHDSSSVILVAVVGVIIFGLAVVGILVAVYCYIRVSRNKKAADHLETRVLNSRRKGANPQEFSSESL